MPAEISRRDFVAVTGGAVAAVYTHAVPAPAPAPAGAPPEGSIILFQGDSITDAGRDRANAAPNQGSALGTGYPLMVAAALLRAHPDRELEFLNRGVSGNKVPDLVDRWETDTLALNPDIISILVGVNDYWHTRTKGYTGTVSDYESGFRALLLRTQQRLPKGRLVVMEPFVLRTGAVDDTWFPEFELRRLAALRVAKQVGATVVLLQQAFTDAAMNGGPSYWIGDGVHPTPAGHALIAERWRIDAGW